MNSNSKWRRLYGAPAWTLPVLLGGLLVTGYAVDRVLRGPMAIRILVWFGAAAVLHDFVLFPAYSLVDRTLSAARRKSRAGHVSAINYFRVPAALSLLMLLIYLPTILGRGAGTFAAASGLGQIDIALRWVLLSCGFFAGSAAVYLCRLLLFHSSTKERS